MLPPHVEEKKSALITFLAKLGISSDKIHNTDMLITAFVHKSYAADFAGLYEHNERLEFLGDSVLGMVVAKHVYNTYPDLSEADLTLYKIALVRAETLAQVATDCGLAEVILIGKGEEKQQGRQKTTILCDCMEALLGYIYLDCGIDTVENVVQKYIIEKLELIIQGEVKSYKSQLQEHIQKLHKVTPQYKHIESKDEQGNLIYTAQAYMNDTLLGSGQGTNKKKAEEEAAKASYNSEAAKTNE